MGWTSGLTSPGSMPLRPRGTMPTPRSVPMTVIVLGLTVVLLAGCAGPGGPFGTSLPQTGCIVLGAGSCTTLPATVATPQKTGMPVRLEAGQPDLVGSVECVPIHGAIRDGKQVLLCHRGNPCDGPGLFGVS